MVGRNAVMGLPTVLSILVRFKNGRAGCQASGRNFPSPFARNVPPFLVTNNPPRAISEEGRRCDAAVRESDIFCGLPRSQTRLARILFEEGPGPAAGSDLRRP